MNISLTPELDSYVQDKVKTGMYHSASEVIREGLRLLMDNDQLREIKLDQLRKAVDISIEQVANGQYVTYKTSELPALSEYIIEQGRKKLADELK